MVDWGKDYGVLPSHIWLFLDFRDIEQEISWRGQNIDAGIWAVVENASEVADEVEEGEAVWSSMFLPYAKDVKYDEDGNRERDFWLISVDTFHEPTCMVPDIGNEEEDAAYFRLTPRNEWADLFSAWLRQPHAREFQEEE